MKISQKIKTFIRISFYCWLLTFIFYNILMSKSKVYFSPDDKPTIQLINNIKKAKTRIYAAIYLITDKKIAQALINAKQIQGVDVQIITDQFSLETPYEKINLLKQNNIDVFVFKGKQQNAAIMHDKFAIFDKQVWTGSFNWTISANKRNQENVIITDERDVCHRYLQQFEKLKRRCILTKNHSTQIKKQSEPLHIKAKNKIMQLFHKIKKKMS